MTAQGESAQGRREELLRCLAVGERTLADPEVREMFDADPQFAAQARELVALQRSLDAIGITAALTPEPELEDIAARAIRARVAAVRARRRLRGWALTAAAVVLVAVVVWLWQPWRREVAPERLGGLKVEVVDEGAALRFALNRPETGHFVVRVYDGEARSRHDSPRLGDPYWRPDLALVERWQPDWWVRIELLDGGEVVEKADVRWAPGQRVVWPR